MSTTALVRTSRWKAVALSLVVVLAGLVLRDGLDRRAADATQPLAGNISPGSDEQQRPAPMTLKIGSFNIHSGQGTDHAKDLSRTAELLKSVDFAGLYEVRATPRDKLPNQAAALGELCQAEWLFAPVERQWWQDHFGNGLLTRLAVRSVMRLPLENTRGKAYRNAIMTTIPLHGAEVHVIAVHVDSQQDRLRQLRTVIDLFLGLQKPCILMGDLNTTANDPLLIRLREEQDVSSPLHEIDSDGLPAQTIDWIFARGLKTVSAELVTNTASDHPFLKAEFALLEAEQ